MAGCGRITGHLLEAAGDLRGRLRPVSGPPAPPVPVTFVSSHAQLGGSERYLELLLEHLGTPWIRSVVLLQDGPFVERLRERGIAPRVVETPARLGILPAAVRLRRTLLADRPAVVHANGVKAALVSGVAMLGSGVPIVWVKHDTSLDGPIGSLTARLVRRVVGVSGAVLEAFGPRLRHKLDVVHNGVPETHLDRAAARAAVAGLHGGPDDAPVVLVVGRLDPAKGQGELVEVLPALRDEHPDVRALLLGGKDPAHPAYEGELRRRARELGVEDSVVFLGHRPAGPEIVAGADVVALTTVPAGRIRGEGFGLVGVEALFAGTPVVGYTSGALPEVLGDCAVLVPLRDRGALAQALLEVLGDAALRERLVRCGRERARARFTIERVATEMAARYRALAA